jgi:hypothetical protein
LNLVLAQMANGSAGPVTSLEQDFYHLPIAQTTAMDWSLTKVVTW